MRRTRFTRFICLMLTLAVLMPATMAAAETVHITSNNSYVDTYWSRSTSDPSGYRSRIDAYSENVDGWYSVHMGYGTVYVPSGSVAVVGATPDPDPDPTPTPTPTLAPGVTPSPKPVEIGGEKDPTYTGTILNYTVPATGLAIYSKMNESSQVDTLKSGTKVQLSTAYQEDGTVVSGWYSLVNGGKTYYVPKSLLVVGADPTASPRPGVEGSVEIPTGGVNYYYDYIRSPKQGATEETDYLKDYAGQLNGGVRINIKHVNAYVYSFTDGSTTYYFLKNKAELGSESSATVVGNEDAKLTSFLRLPAVSEDDVDGDGNPIRLRLYPSASTGSIYYTLPDSSNFGQDITLQGVKDIEGWYRVAYNNKIYYIKTSDLENYQAKVSQVVVNDTVSTSTFYIVIGVNGADLYSSAARNTIKDADNAGHKTSHRLSAGANVLVSQYNGYWYAYSYQSSSDSSPRVYYVHRDAVSNSSSANQMSAYRVLLDPVTIGLYDNTKSTSPSAKKLPGNAETYFTVHSVDATWFSIVLDGTTYYIKKSDLNPDTKADPIASTVTGKTYDVTIGTSGAVTYTDSSCTTQAHITYEPGAVVRATKYTSTLYTVSVGNANVYLPAAYVVAIRGGNDGGSQDPNNPSSGNIGEIIKGETNSDYKRTVLSYTVPASGLWLYHQTSESTPAMVLAAGKVVKLNGIPLNASNDEDPDWYSTFYGGSEYFVPTASLKPTTVNTNSTYSITLTSTVALYEKATQKTEVGTSATGARFTDRYFDLTVDSGIRLNAGVRANVKIYAYYYVEGKTTNTVHVYTTVHNGKTYYFYGRPWKTDQDNVDVGSYLNATAGDNSNASLITKFELDPANSPKLYAYASTSSSSVDIKVPTTVYGISYDKDWYQVIYNNASWYLLKSSAQGDQITITEGIPSTTFSVVIGSKGATLYKTMATDVYENNKKVTNAILDANGNPVTLSAGTTILANRESGAWYSYFNPQYGRTAYFQNNVVSNSISSNTVSSYVINLASDTTIYGSISANPTPLSGKLPGGNTYTMRNVDSGWSSVFYKGTTFYVKNTDIAQERYESVPVASTSVGKTYTITLGNFSNMMVYNASSLTPINEGRGPLPGGYTTNGTKMYNSEADTLVYQIKFNGITGYIDASYVTGVRSGDEVDEAKEAQESGGTGGTTGPVGDVTVGSSITRTLNAGTILYVYMSTAPGADSYELPSTITVTLYKDSNSWYSLYYNGDRYYMPVNVVESSTGTGESGGGGSVAVGDTVMETLRTQVTTYSSADSDASAVGYLMPNQLIKLKKVNDLWFEHELASGRYVYVKVADVYAASSGTGTGTGSTTTDSKGAIITAMIEIAPSTGTVNLRRSATTASTALVRIPKGTQVANNGYEIDSGNNIWYKTSYQGKTGYVIGTYVKAVGTVTGGGTTTTGDPSNDVGRTLTVNVPSVNVRAGAGSSYSIIGSLTRNANIIPTGYKYGDDGMVWYSFKYNASTTAYIRYDYLSGGLATNAQLSGYAAVKAGGTNLRSGAGDNYGVILQLPRDAIVSILSTTSGKDSVLWYNISYNGTKGYVRHDLLRQLTNSESGGLPSDIVGTYKELKYGNSGPEVVALQNQLIKLGYLSSGQADGVYGVRTTDAVKAFQRDKGISQTGVADATTQAAMYSTTSPGTSTGTTTTLDWFSGGEALMKANPNLTVYDIKSGCTWSAKYIEGSYHADVVPASVADAQKLQTNNITGYIRRPVIVTIAGQKFAGSMYAEGHGSTNFVSWFSGVMCIHFTGSKTHGSGVVDADHQKAIQDALNSGF